MSHRTCNRPRRRGRCKSAYQREVARKEAEERDAARAVRNPEQQLFMLDMRLGHNVGAVKERSRLQCIIDSPPKPKKEKKSDVSRADK